LEEKQKIDEEIKEADAILQSKNVTIEAINEHIQLNEELNKHGLSTNDIHRLLNVLLTAKEYIFSAGKIVGKLRSIKECNNVLPLAQKIVVMNIDISELIALDTAVNEIARVHNLPLSVAAFRLFRDIRDYNKIGGLKKELSGLYLRKFTIDEACSRQSQALITLAKLQSHGITEDKMLYVNNLLQKKGYNAI
jgi:hypothetical protein